MENPHLVGASMQRRCAMCHSILLDSGLCLECAEGVKTPSFQFGLAAPVNKEPVAPGDCEPQADDWHSGDRDTCGQSLFDFEALEEQLSAAVASPQATRGRLEGQGSKWSYF